MKVKCQYLPERESWASPCPYILPGFQLARTVYDKPARNEDLHHHPSLLLRPLHLWQAWREMHLQSKLPLLPPGLGPRRTSWRRCSFTKLSCSSRFQSFRDNFSIITQAKQHPPTNRTRAVTGHCPERIAPAVRSPAKTVSGDSEVQASPCSAVWLH